jgi:hypothetical protein
VKTGGSGSVGLDTSGGKDETLLGTFHTHPYSKAEGGHKGAPFSGGDIANLTVVGGTQGTYKFIEAGTKRFALEVADREKFEKFAKANDIRDLFNKEMAATEKSIKNFPARNRAAVRAIVNKKDSGLKFYETTDKAKLKFREVK